MKLRTRVLIGIMVMTLLVGCSTNPAPPEKTESEIPPETPAQAGMLPDEEAYIGEYLDSDVGEPNLEIAKQPDGTYLVQIGIYRLASLSDGSGEITAEGMTFTATDPAGNPIRGIITIEDKTATVTFTDSTWDYLENGAAFQYVKSSDRPDIWPV